jgi:hypothetical protein
MPAEYSLNRDSLMNGQGFRRAAAGLDQVAGAVPTLVVSFRIKTSTVLPVAKSEKAGRRLSKND